MTYLTVTKHTLLSKKITSIVILLLIMSILLTLTIDFIEAKFHHTSYYLSESFLFSSFWWLFAPILLIQNRLVQTKRINYTWIFILSVILHVFLYPFIVTILSWLFYDNTFNYFATFTYGLTEYSILLFIIYALPFLQYLHIFNIHLGYLGVQNENIKEATAQKSSHLEVCDSSNNNVIISTNEIVLLTANPPYVNIQLDQKKYLHHTTLKSILTLLDPNFFIRIHKSMIVNIRYVKSYKSRLNGDFDLTLKEGSVIRLSRNYSAKFKLIWTKYHRLTIK